MKNIIVIACLFFLASCHKKMMNEGTYIGYVHINDHPNFNLDGEFQAKTNKDKETVFTFVNDTIPFYLKLTYDNKHKDYRGIVNIGDIAGNYKGKKTNDTFEAGIFGLGYDNVIPIHIQYGSIYLTLKK